MKNYIHNFQVQASPSAPPQEDQPSNSEQNGQKVPEEEDPNEIFKDASIQVCFFLDYNSNFSLGVYSSVREARRRHQCLLGLQDRNASAQHSRLHKELQRGLAPIQRLPWPTRQVN